LGGLSVPDWRAEHLRLTVFLEQDVHQPTHWWREVVGQEPATQLIQQGIGIRQLGPIRNGYCQLSLELSGRRVEWLMNTQVQLDQPSAGFPSFDTFPRGLAVFRELLLPWVSRIEGVLRVAIGAILTFPVTDKLAGYAALRPLLPALEIDPTGSSDLVYQINRHGRSRVVDGLHVNRLSAWTVVQFKMVLLQVQAGGVPATIGGEAPQSQAVRLQLDINTDADRTTPLPSGRMAAITEELITLGEEIADRGDQR